jgi:tetratricopeptide (TPR) repeat protein
LGLLGFIVFLCALAAFIAASGLIGARSGSAEMQTRSTATVAAQIIEWFQRGLDQMKQGNYPLAEANFVAVLKVQPDNAGVQELLATARAAQTPTPVPPTVTPTPIITDKGELLRRIEQAIQQQEWTVAINLCDQLRALDINYERARVDEWRYEALVARGKQRLKDDEIEAGLYDLDIAASIHDLDAATESERQLAGMYQNALNYVGADWGKTIQLLTELYDVAPRYRDVAARLFGAYVSMGDAYAEVQNWCPAEARYADAIKFIANPKTEQKHSEAQQKCLTATPVIISGTNGLSGTIQGASISGRLIFAALDPSSGAPQLRSYAGESAQQNTIEGGGGQPAYQPSVGVVVYALGGAIHGYYSNGAVSPIAAGGAWPSISPDGTRVAYSADAEGKTFVFIAPVNGSSPPVRLAEGRYPVWGPTNRIAFQGCSAGGCGIHIINPDQPSEMTNLTTTDSDISIQWSPDGSQLVYTTRYTGNWEIYTVNMSKQFRQITSGGGLTGAPTFSPDGSRIAFVSNRDGNWAIYVVSSLGGEAAKVLDLGQNFPAWQTERMAWMP